MSNELKPFSVKYKKNRTVLKDVLPLEKPFCISIEPSNLCNFKCVMCHHSSENYKKKAGPLLNMSNLCFNKIVEDLKQWGNSKLKVIKLYSMGEPLLNKNICKMVKKLKEENLSEVIEITTNGSLLNKQMSEELIQYGLDYLRISIYSVIKEKNEHITGSNITPSTIRHNVCELKQIRDKLKSVKPFIQAKIIDTYNDEENKIFIENYQDIVDEVFIDKPMNSNFGEDVLKNLYGENSLEVNKNIHELYYYKRYKACRYPFDHLTVKSNGDVVVCCADWLRATKIGNVMENTLEEIWNGKKLYEFRKMQLENKRYLNKSCKNCEIPLRDQPEDDLTGVSINKFK
ncbi:radical SAM/SPASM domain-containing protein [Vallitalea guaymasensis]|uniref:SPASM domain-containing protein n=1 Tax=Vallitalea guaymasensis TaxID=1185412 RepID=A0A8J8SBS1_9FIRM|nr:radical SAM/SPASM domain-containing protein [Vallitalea guaymasensis]QUH28972.1 SPASM domain-containing protein [Vallitalea guaymasensis]